MLLVSTTGTTGLLGRENEDGIFEVDHETGTGLLLFPGWRHATEAEVAAFYSDVDAEKKAATEAKRQATIAAKKAAATVTHENPPKSEKASEKQSEDLIGELPKKGK